MKFSYLMEALKYFTKLNITFLLLLSQNSSPPPKKKQTKQHFKSDYLARNTDSPPPKNLSKQVIPDKEN